MQLSTLKPVQRQVSYKSGKLLLTILFLLSLFLTPWQEKIASAAIDPSWSATYEAETAQLTGVIVQSTNGGFTGTGYADYQHINNDQISWTINVPQAGNYFLLFRYANGSSDLRPLDIYVNGQLHPYGTPGLFLSTGSWTTWSTVGVSAALQTGSNVIATKVIGYNGPNIDHLKVALPLFQGESATLAGGARITNVNPGYTGTGYIYFREVNSSAEWVINNPAPGGTYNLYARYANSYPLNSNIRLDLTVNGVSAGSPPFYPTGSWSVYDDTTIAGVTLQNGQNTIKLSAPQGSWSPIIDYIWLEYIPGR